MGSLLFECMQISSEYLSVFFYLQLKLKAEHVSHELQITDTSETAIKKGAKKTRSVLLC